MDTIASLQRHIMKLRSDISIGRREADTHKRNAADRIVDGRTSEAASEENIALRLNTAADQLEREIEHEQQKIEELSAMIMNIEDQEATIKQALVDNNIRLEKETNDKLRELDRQKRRIRGE